MSTKIADIQFLTSRDKNFILLLACFVLILPDCLHWQAYSFSLAILPSSPLSARVESNIESGIFANILHSNSFFKNKSISELKVNMCMQCVLLVDKITIQDKTKTSQCTFNQKLTTILMKLTKINKNVQLIASLKRA